MPKRIQILACSFALGVAMLLLGATAAQAAPGGGGGGSPSPSPIPPTAIEQIPPVTMSARSFWSPRNLRAC